MADFTNHEQKEASVAEALAIRNAIRSWYAAGKAIKRYIDRYAAGADTTYNSAVNALYTAAQRTELSAVATKAQANTADLEANHASLVGYVPPEG